MIRVTEGGQPLTYTIVWEFVVPPAQAAAFEAAYGPAGPWAQLFHRARGFVALQLLKCDDRAGRYLTLDCWESPAAFEAFKRDFAAAYQALDALLEGLAAAETRLGGFSPCQARPPDRGR